MTKIIFTFLILFSTNLTATRFKTGTVIRDAEIEHILHSYFDPIAKIAGLKPSDLKVYMMVDPHLNAFATFNTTLFLTTGTLLKASGPDEIIGVGAHEIGHIKGNHLARHDQEMANSNKTALLGAAAGLILGVLTNNYNVGMAGVMGGMGAGMQNFLKYSQGEESTADGAALQYLKKLGWPTQGLLTFMQRLQAQELLSEKLQDPYVRTHPISRHRIETIRSFTKLYTPLAPLPQKFFKDFKRMQLKLEAFLSPPSFILQKYSGDTPDDLMVQAIAYHVQGDVEKSLERIEIILKTFQNDPYIWELKGQIMLESGRPHDAIGAYEKAVGMRPQDSLLLFGVAHALLATENDAYLSKVIDLMKQALVINVHEPQAYHFLAVAEGRLGHMGKMALALSQEAAHQGEWERSMEQADRARQNFDCKKNKILYTQADDLYQAAKLKLESGVDLRP